MDVCISSPVEPSLGGAVVRRSLPLPFGLEPSPGDSVKTAGPGVWTRGSLLGMLPAALGVVVVVGGGAVVVVLITGGCGGFTGGGGRVVGCCCTFGDRDVVDEPFTNQSITNYNKMNYCQAILQSKMSVITM